MNSTEIQQFLEPCKRFAKEAGARILRHDPQTVAIRKKTDGSMVSDADQEANDHIVAALQQLAPDIPIIAEENENREIGNSKRFWLVDALDGTDSYLRGEKEFTVNIALIEDGRPVLGVIYDPSNDVLYWSAKGSGAWRNNGQGAESIHINPSPKDQLKIIKSRRRPSPAFINRLNGLVYGEMQLVGSSIKFCRVAEGSADLYPRFGDTMEWDTAAGHAILNEAGGHVVAHETGKELTYGKPAYKNPHFVASGRDYSLSSIASQTVDSSLRP